MFVTFVPFDPITVTFLLVATVGFVAIHPVAAAIRRRSKLREEERERRVVRAYLMVHSPTHATGADVDRFRAVWHQHSDAPIPDAL